MKVLTFDIECENHTFNKRKASPFDPRNYIVEIGYNINGGEVKSERFEENHRQDVMVDALNSLEKGDIINGFNIKFDLLWIWQQESLQNALKRGVQIYDGQYAEYLMGGMTQDVQMISMNETAEQYGGGLKVDAIKEMWQAGMLTSEIPADLLHDYLCGDGEEIVGDVQNTWLIYEGQIKRMEEEHPKDFQTMLKYRFYGLLATTEMEYNGVYVNKQKGEELRAELIKELDEASEELESFIPELPKELTFNWSSNSHKSALIYGGAVKYKKWMPNLDDDGNVIYTQKTIKAPLFNNEPVLDATIQNELYIYKGMIQDVYGSGKRKGEGKFKNVKVDDLEKPKGALRDQIFYFKGYTKPDPKWMSANTDAIGNPMYSTGAGIIEELAKRDIPFLKALIKRTKLNKDLGTYYWTEDNKGKRKGMLELVDEHNIIHHKLNHTSTVTGRLSSSDPNLQNVPRGDTSNVKKMFQSRFDDGLMAEIDYSQLEVVVQGVLSGDKQLEEDLINRVDFHCKRLSAKLGEDYDSVVHKCKVEEDPEYKKMRTNAKHFSFQRAYGAGANAIAESTGMSKEEVEKLIEAEETLYPSVVDFDRNLEEEIKANRILSGNKLFLNGVAFSQGESHWDSPTGTRYIWRESITPDFMHKSGKYTGFSPTERKNYPVQGFGGEIVQTMLGLVFKYMLKNDRFGGDVLLVNTVHDCVWLDGKADKVAKVAKTVQKILESVPKTFNTLYKEMDIKVPFPCETEVGSDMFDMDVLH